MNWRSKFWYQGSNNRTPPLQSSCNVNHNLTSLVVPLVSPKEVLPISSGLSSVVRRMVLRFPSIESAPTKTSHNIRWWFLHSCSEEKCKYWIKYGWKGSTTHLPRSCARSRGRRCWGSRRSWSEHLWSVPRSNLWAQYYNELFIKGGCSPLVPPLNFLARVPDSSLPSSASDLRTSSVAMVPLRLVVGMAPPPWLGRSSSPPGPPEQVAMQLIGTADNLCEGTLIGEVRTSITNLFFLSQHSLRLGLWQVNSPVGVDSICPVGQSGHDVRWWRRAFAFWGLWGRFWWSFGRRLCWRFIWPFVWGFVWALRVFLVLFLHLVLFVPISADVLLWRPVLFLLRRFLSRLLLLRLSRLLSRSHSSHCVWCINLRKRRKKCIHLSRQEELGTLLDIRGHIRFYLRIFLAKLCHPIQPSSHKLNMGVMGNRFFVFFYFICFTVHIYIWYFILLFCISFFSSILPEPRICKCDRIREIFSRNFSYLFFVFVFPWTKDLYSYMIEFVVYHFLFFLFFVYCICIL